MNKYDMEFIGTLGAVRVYTSPSLGQVETITVKKPYLSWFPFFKKDVLVTTTVPSSKPFFLDDGETMVAHPDTLDIVLKDMLNILKDDNTRLGS